MSAGVIENSRTAFQAAIARGYGIELDVQMSADGEAMTFHDYDLLRLTGKEGRVQTSSAVELGAMVLTGGSDAVPTLAETLDLVSGRVPLLIEVKDQDGALGRDIGPLEHRLAGLLQGYKGPVAVMSFNPHSVAALAEFAPQIARGRVTCAFDEWEGLDAASLAALRPITPQDGGGISFISHDRRDLRAQPVADAKDAGLDVLCWTVRSVSEAEIALEVAQNITFEGFLPPVSSVS